MIVINFKCALGRRMTTLVLKIRTESLRQTPQGRPRHVYTRLSRHDRRATAINNNTASTTLPT